MRFSTHYRDLKRFGLAIVVALSPMFVGGCQETLQDVADSKATESADDLSTASTNTIENSSAQPTGQSIDYAAFAARNSVNAEDQATIDAIKKITKFKYELESGSVVLVDFAFDVKPTINEEVMKLVSQFKRLEKLRTIGVGLPDEGLKYLAELKSLRYLNANYNATDAGLSHLSSLTNLEELTLTGSKVTDSGLSIIARMSNLKKLSLSHAKGVTDAGIQHLAGLTKLEELILAGTQVTDEGIKQLQQELPNLEIEK